MVVRQQPTTSVPEWEEDTDQAARGAPDADREGPAPQAASDWQAYSIDILTAFLDP